MHHTPLCALVISAHEHACSVPSPPHQVLLSLLSSLSLYTPTSVHPAPKLVQIVRGTPLAGITAFRGARETSLWFLDGASAASGTAGILGDARPAEFWAAADLARGDAGGRVLSSTRRTCTVVLTRRPTTSIEGSEESGGKRDGVSDDRWEGEGDDRRLGAEA